MAMKRDKEGHYMMIKVSIQEEDIALINIYAPNIGAWQYVRQILTRMKGEINNNTIIVGDFSTPLTPMDRSTKQKINKGTQTLNDTMVLLLLLSHFSRVRLCATPQTAAHHSPLSLGFSRQEHWSGLPFPSPMHESEK